MHKHRRTIAGMAALLAVELVAAVGLAHQAHASTQHWVYDQTYVWVSDSGDYCLRNRTSATADDASHDQTSVTARTFTRFLPTDRCTWGLVPWSRGNGNIANRTHLYIWAPKPGWVFCATLPWVYLPASGSFLAQDHTWKDSTLMGCYAAHGIYHPRGWMAADGGTYVRGYDGGWKPPSDTAGWVWSGGHAFDRG